MTAAGLLAASFFFGYGVGVSSSRSGSGLELLEEAKQQIDSSALLKPPDRVLVEGAVRGMLEGLGDPHAGYLTPEAYRAFGEELLNGQFSGVGVWLNKEKEAVKVVSVLARSPAEAAGIRVGDVITAVGGQPVTGLTLDEVSQKIMGRPGTRVRLGVTREGSAHHEFVVEREKLDFPAVNASMNGRAGVIEVVSFTGGVGRKVREAVASLAKQGARGFILDLRGNPGGSLEEAVAVASVFLDDGVVVAYRERGKPEFIYEAQGPAETHLPLIIVVDEGSASASEIVAGAVQDRQRGLIVGTETYKKGSVQRVFGLSDGSAIKLTIASYFTPSGRAIGERGVMPDVNVAERDKQVPRANEILSGILAQSSAGPAG
ncbi:MAG: S41 family peptidase [Actinomycetota bacterium]|nr:S41 family peptidase [Actinomycetota bacterium]